MKNIASLFIVVSFYIIITGCSSEKNIPFKQQDLNIKLVDSAATLETIFLYSNLKKLAEDKIIFGHQDATAYGVDWKNEQDKSDLKEITNSHPGVYGWDFGSLYWEPHADLEKHPLRKLVTEAYYRGGVNIFCWHANNPATDRSFYDTTVVVPKIIPGGGYYLKYLRTLDYISDFIRTLKDSTGKPIPIIFRPFHEFDGSWFWWGKNFSTKEEFVELWKTTIDYFKNKKELNNIIYAFSPDRNFYNKEQYLERYPGDGYVDIVGTDIYYDFTPDGDGLDWIKRKLKIVTKIANDKNKIAAFTETGLEGVVNHEWWTDRLLNVIDDDSINISFVMVWRNADQKHHYAPYINHPSAGNFVEFSLTDKILLQNSLPSLYTYPINVVDIVRVENKKRFILFNYFGLYPPHF